MKLSYQLLKKLILEQLEVQTSDMLRQLRDLAYNPSPQDLVAAYEIYEAALDEPDKNTLIIDYYESHFPKLSPQQRQALKEPDVLILVDDMIEGRDNRGRYVGAKLFTYDTTAPDFRGIPLGVLRVYPASQDQVGGSFLGDENFTLPYDETLYIDNRNSPQTNSEILDWLNEKLDIWVRGKGRQQYVEFILNA